MNREYQAPNSVHEEKRSAGNETVSLICKKLKFPAFVRTTAQGIFCRCLSVDASLDKLCYMSIILAAKLTDHFVAPDMFRVIEIDGNLEIRMAERLDFDFDIFDVFTFVKDISAVVKGEEALAGQVKAIEDVFAAGAGTLFRPFGGSLDLSNLALAVFTDAQLKIFETVSCIEIDLQKVQSVRKLALHSGE